MGPGEWLAEFDRRGDEFRAAQAAFHREVGAAIAAERDGARGPVVRPVVLAPGRDVDRGAEAVSRSGAGLLDLAHSLGWAARLVAAVAADPAKGLIRTVTLRFSRHDERGYAAWWNGQYEGGWYVGPDGLEPLAGTPFSSRESAAATRAAKAAADGKPVPAPVKMIRGVRDVLEGIRLTRH